MDFDGIVDKSDKEFLPKRNKIYSKYDEHDEVASLRADCPFCYVFHYKKEKFGEYKFDKWWILTILCSL